MSQIRSRVAAFLGQAGRRIRQPGSRPAAASPRCASSTLGSIVTPNWQYNDEYNYAEGEEVLPKVYFDQQRGRSRMPPALRAVLCTTRRRWTSRWIFSSYRDELSEDATEDTVTWEQLLQAGFPEPFSVQELET